jgi:hypothetical protein
VIVPGDPEKSAMVRVIRYADKNMQMPSGEQLTSREVATLVEWVRAGAPDPRTGQVPKPAGVIGKGGELVVYCRGKPGAM